MPAAKKDNILLSETPSQGVLLLTLNRPDNLNAFDEDLCRALDAALAAAADDDNVRCIILAGAGERAFSAGYDVKELAQYNKEEFVVQNIMRYEWIWNIAEHPKPIIALNQGIAMGAGAIIFVSADLRLGTDQSYVRFTSTPHGAAMLTWNLPQIVGWSKAKEYLMTSCKINSAEASSSGLLNRVTSNDELIPKAIEMAEAIAACEPSGPQDVKRLMRETQGKTQREQMENELRLLQSQQLDIGNRVGEWFEDIVEPKN